MRVYILLRKLDRIKDFSYREIYVIRLNVI